MSRPKIKDTVLAIDPFDVSQRPTPAQLIWAEWFKSITDHITSKKDEKLDKLLFYLPNIA